MPKGSVNFMAPISQEERRRREDAALSEVFEKRDLMLKKAPGYYAPQDVENFGPAIADIAAYQGIPMPQPQGRGGVYLPEQYTDLVGQYYMAPPDAAAQRQTFLNRFRASMAGSMPSQEAPPAIRGATYGRRGLRLDAGGAPEYMDAAGYEQPGFLNQLRALLGY